MSELKIKEGDWVVLGDGEVRRPPNIGHNALIDWSGDYRWYRSGRISPDRKSQYDIVAVLPCPPLERIRQLEDALRPFADQAFYYEPPENDDHTKIWDCDLTLGNLRAAKKALEASQ